MTPRRSRGAGTKPVSTGGGGRAALAAARCPSAPGGPAVAGHVVDARQLVLHGELERPDDVVLFDELHEWVVAADAGHGPERGGGSGRGRGRPGGGAPG